MDKFLYVCPECGLGSWTMEVSEELSYLPTSEDLESKLWPRSIQNEVLICSCGAVNNWFTLKELKYVGRVVTSPPYFGLRKYGGGEKEIGIDLNPNYIELAEKRIQEEVYGQT